MGDLFTHPSESEIRKALIAALSSILSEMISRRMWIKPLHKYSLTCLFVSNGLFSVSCTKSLKNLSLSDRFLADFTESPEEPFFERPFPCWFHWITRGTFLGMTVSLLILLNHQRNVSWNDRFLSDFTESPEKLFFERAFPWWFYWITRGTFPWMTVSFLISLNHQRNLSLNDRFLFDFTESPEEPFFERPFPCWFYWITRGTFLGMTVSLLILLNHQMNLSWNDRASANSCFLFVMEWSGRRTGHRERSQ